MYFGGARRPYGPSLGNLPLVDPLFNLQSYYSMINCKYQEVIQH